MLIRRMIKVIVFKPGGSAFLPATYTFFNTLLLVLNPHVERIIWEESFAKKEMLHLHFYLTSLYNICLGMFKENGTNRNRMEFVNCWYTLVMLN